MEHPSFAEVMHRARNQEARSQSRSGKRSALDLVVRNNDTWENELVTVTGATPVDDLFQWSTELGAGAFRDVRGFRPDRRYVLKYARNADRAHMNQHEVQVYKRATVLQQQYLTKPFVWSRDFRWVIMERVIVGLPEYNDPGQWGRAERHDRLIEVGEALGVSDIHGANIGERLDGSPVILDYGM